MIPGTERLDAQDNLQRKSSYNKPGNTVSCTDGTINHSVLSISSTCSGTTSASCAPSVPSSTHPTVLCPTSSPLLRQCWQVASSCNAPWYSVNAHSYSPLTQTRSIMLWGRALDWPEVFLANWPIASLTYEQFVWNLTSVFDHPNHVGTASSWLVMLKQGSHSVADSLEFCTLAADSQWNEAALRSFF